MDLMTIAWIIAYLICGMIYAAIEPYIVDGYFTPYRDDERQSNGTIGFGVLIWAVLAVGWLCIGVVRIIGFIAGGALGVAEWIWPRKVADHPDYLKDDKNSGG